jgi:hypothetical protein
MAIEARSGDTQRQREREKRKKERNIYRCPPPLPEYFLETERWNAKESRPGGWLAG